MSKEPKESAASVCSLVLVRKTTHYFKPLTEATRPQDDGNLTFKVVEHGIDSFPLSIRVEDSEGRWCVYAPITEQGCDVQSHGFFSMNVDLKTALARDNEELRNGHSLQQASL